MADDEERHRDRVQRIVAGNQQTDQHHRDQRGGVETRAFFEITQVLDGFPVEVFAFVNQRYRHYRR